MSCAQHYYADDTQVYLSFDIDESQQAIAALNVDLYELNEISRKHCLTLNPKKSIAIVFGRRGDREQFLETFSQSIKLNDQVIPFRSCVKNLGLHIDNDLRFTEHVSQAVKRAYAGLKLLYTNRHVFDKNTKTLLCNSLVLSHFNYCDVIYGPCLTAFDSNRVQKVQNSCLRLIHGIRKFQHISHAFELSEWLRMSDRRYIHSACMYHSILLNKTPPYLYNKITFRTDVHNVNIRFKHTLTTPIHYTELFKRAFSYNIVMIINGIPFDLKTCSIHSFKKNIVNLTMPRQ